MTSYKLVRYQYQVAGHGGNCSASKGPANPYRAHRVLPAIVTTIVALIYRRGNNFIRFKFTHLAIFSRFSTNIQTR